MKKMNVKTMMPLVMALGLLLGSCNKEETGPDGVSDHMTTVQLKITHPEDPGSRAVGTPIDATTQIELKEGHLFFASQNLVTKYVKIVNSSTPGSGEVSVAQLNAGHEIANVPDNSTQIFLLSNIPSTVTVPTAVSTPVETLKAVRIAAADMGAANGSVSAVSLYGQGTIGANSSGDPDDPQEAEVTVHAIASRIEIAKIIGDDKVDDFSVAGIYINHYYEQTSVDGTTGTNLVDHQSETAKYVTGNTGGYDFTNGILHDAFSPAEAASSLEVTPSTGVWAYQILPTTTAPAIPHIIVVLEDVVIDGVTLTGQQYLTIRGFKNSGSDLTAMEKGYVYKIDEIRFTQDQVTDQPEVGAFSVDITLALTNWKVANLIVDWDK